MQTILKDNRGFTLVELAIVMIIIGLLIGGTLKGQQLIDSAKVTSTISQIKNIQTGFNSFYDTYGGYAGDLKKATNRITGCDAAATCSDGDGDGFVEGVVNTTAAGTTSVATMSIDTAATTESNQAWKQLALAGLVTGVDPSVDLTSLAYGESHPSSSLRGGFDFYFDNDITERNNGGAGTILRLSNQSFSGGTVGSAGVEAMTPSQAANLDRKMDDGVYNTGALFTISTGASGSETCANTSGYIEKDQSPDCPLFFVLN